MEAFTCPSDIAPFSMPRGSLHSLMKCKYSVIIHKENLSSLILRSPKKRRKIDSEYQKEMIKEVTENKESMNKGY